MTVVAFGVMVWSLDDVVVQVVRMLHVMVLMYTCSSLVVAVPLHHYNCGSVQRHSPAIPPQDAVIYDLPRGRSPILMA